jgi:hypothetical protein
MENAMDKMTMMMQELLARLDNFTFNRAGDIITMVGGKQWTWGAAAPTTGTWAVGDICWYTATAAAGTVGWVCTTAGTPGTWLAFGTIAAS